MPAFVRFSATVCMSVVPRRMGKNGKSVVDCSRMSYSSRSERRSKEHRQRTTISGMIAFEIEAEVIGQIDPKKVQAIILRLASRNEEFGRADVQRLRAVLMEPDVSALTQVCESYRKLQGEIVARQGDWKYNAEHTFSVRRAAAPRSATFALENEMDMCQSVRISKAGDR